MEFAKKNKIVLGIAIVTLIISFVVLSRMAKDSKKQGLTEDVLNNEPTIAMVDSSVTVEVGHSAKKGEIEIDITNSPAGTEKADIEMSYDRKPQATDDAEGAQSIPDGVLTACTFRGNSRDCHKDGITLGTCSSGVCRYHQLAGPIKVIIRFAGTYGEKLFEKEYVL